MKRKTKQEYARSLFGLLKKTSFDKITISQICDNTSLTRRTFYNNFNSKEDVVVFSCEEMMEEFITRVHQGGVYTLKAISMIFYTYGATRSEIFLTLIRNDIFHYVIKTFIENAKYLGSLIPNSPLDKETEVRRNYTYMFHSVGVLKLFEQWLTTGMPESPEELSDIYLSIVSNVKPSDTPSEEL